MGQALQKILCGVGEVSDSEMTTYMGLQGFVRMKVRTYTGDTTANKTVRNVGFQPTLVIVYEKVDAKNFAIKTSGDTTGSFLVIEGHTHYLVDQIISLDSDGFTIGDGTGSSDYLNEAQDYVYIAFG